MTSPSRSEFEEDRRQFVLGQMEYWRKVRESGGFDLENIPGPQGTTGMTTFNTERREDYPYRDRVNRYARFGLHRYNMCQGTQLELHHVKKFNMTTTFRAAYYITLAAFDPAFTTSLVTLQIAVSEASHSDRRCWLNLTCFIAKLQGAPSDHPIQLPHHISGRADDDSQFPYWPSDFNDSQRFHEIRESDKDWIRLYLELTLCSTDRQIVESELSQLQILKAAIETIEDGTNEDVVVANIYITFKGFALARFGELGEHVERKVIVTRVINELTGCMTLLGGYGYSFGEEVAKKRYISRPTCNITNWTSSSSEIPSNCPPLVGIFSRIVSS